MTDFKSLFTHDIPLIDVRAPVEFDEGHFETSINLPLMNNDERKAVGTCYKEFGQAKAIELGHSFVQGSIKDARIEAWSKFIDQHPHARLYCFRGGLRSEISCEWIRETGRSIQKIEGGYKALRRFMMNTLEEESKTREFLILAGHTGSGKTKVLSRSPLPFLDLEKFAEHKGSSFGVLGKQPTQITFENRISTRLLKLNPGLTLLEDESVMIGSCVVPRVLFEKMRTSPLVLLIRSFEERILHIAEEYVVEKTKNYGGDFQKTHQFMTDALRRIEKKLGGLNTSMILKQINDAFLSSDVLKIENHFPWIESLLKHYYDPMYSRSIKKNEDRILFQGSEAACIQFLENKMSRSTQT